MRRSSSSLPGVEEALENSRARSCARRRSRAKSWAFRVGDRDDGEEALLPSRLVRVGLTGAVPARRTPVTPLSVAVLPRRE